MNEQIEMYRAVQKHRGPWREYDYCLRVGDGKIGIVLRIYDRHDPPDFKPKQEELLVNFGDERCLFGPDDPDLLWLPPTAPRLGDDDGRNLWDIARGSLGKELKVHEDGGTISIMIDNYGNEWAWDEIATGATLPEALLRAAVGKGDKS